MISTTADMDRKIASIVLLEKVERKAHALAIAKLNLWFAERNVGSFPYHEVVCAYHECGKHFVAGELTEKLARIRDRIRDVPQKQFPNLTAFLDMMLDKHDGRYDYRSYLALTLLSLPADDTLLREPRDARSELDRGIVILAADILRFETEALLGRAAWLPLRQPDREVVEDRCRRALRALLPYLSRLQLADGVDLGDPISSAGLLARRIDAGMNAEERLRLQLTNIPVYVVHDEYMFIRILQCFETVFSWLCANIRQTIAVCASDIRAAIERVRACCDYLREAAPFFHVLFSMDRESFGEFRKYTEGASAIQSRNYKRLESLCDRPGEERLSSIAYQSVPEVQVLAEHGHETLNQAYLQAKTAGCHADAEVAQLGEAMAKFQQALLRWRQSHYAIAVNMLGTGTGTGYTEGAPYLNRVRNLPIFSAIDA